MIQLDDIAKTYRLPERDVVALDGIDLSVAPGEICGVVGGRGSGKTTLLRCVNLLIRPDEGVVRVDGVELTALRGDRLRRARQNVGMLFPGVELLAQRDVARNVGMPLEFADVRRRKRDLRVDELLDLVGMAELAEAYPAQLSDEQRHRVGLARALANESMVLLCDDITSELEPDAADAVLALLRELALRFEVTVVLATPDWNVVKDRCSSVAVLRDGRIAERGRLGDLLARPGSTLVADLLPALPPPAPAPGHLLADLTLVGERAERAVLTETARTFGIDITVVAGSLERVDGCQVGRLRVELQGAVEGCEDALRRFAELDLAPEVHR